MAAPMTNPGPAYLDQVFALLEQAAVKGERCPGNSPHGPITSSVAVPALARDGRICIEIYRHNFRRVTILTGPHAGKSTMSAPGVSPKPYRIVGEKRQQPSRPRLLPYAGRE